MPTSLVSTGVQFPDSTIQTTAAAGGGFSQAQIFTSSGTFTVPSSGKFKVTIIGGGGSGGCGGFPLAAQAGGSAGTVIKWYTGATAGAIATVTIGSGGSGVLGENTAGNSGGNSTFALSGFTTLTAGGGGGGAGGYPVKNNGTASGGNININGQNGMGPAYASDGGNNTRVSTLGGSTPLGLGSSWGMTVSTAASTNYPASGYGAGGGTGNGNVWLTTSGAGTGGICIVEY